MKVLTTAGLTKLIELCKNAIPTVNNPTITITQGGVTKGSFTLNQASGDTIALDAGGGGGYHPELLSHEWDDHERSDMNWVNALNFSWQNRADHQVAYDELASNISGKTLQSETVAGITIQFYLADNGRKICPDTEESNVASIYTATGVAWYYIIDTVNQRFKLPRAKHNKYADSLGVVGNGMTLGLTNGTNTGSLTSSNAANVNPVIANNGYGASIGTITGHDAWTDYAAIGVTSDATKSGIVAQQEQDTDQYKYLYFYVGSFTQSAIENTAGLNASLFNAKADIDAANFSASGKTMIAHLAMPSTSYVDLTLPASGNSITAPADGYIHFAKTSTASNQRVKLYADITQMAVVSWSSDIQNIEVVMPVSKGETVYVTYTAGGTTNYFRFIYANGAA